MPKLFKFIKSGITQTDLTKSFGVNNATTCRVTSSFTISSATSAYAMLPGTVLLQQQSGPGNEGKANLILKPDVITDIQLPVKYIIYRGLNIDDFLTAQNITDASTNVKTSGLEILDKMKIIQDLRSTDDIPVEALFGNDLTPPNTTNIDKFFFKNVPVSSQLFHVDGGVEIGKYVAGDGGIEIILENPEYSPTVEMAKEPFFQISATGSLDKIKWMKDLIRHFVDPAAFYGLHYNIKDGIEYRDNSNVKQIATTKTDVFTQLVEIFQTKNNVYLDIRNENGYSYNYYGNYVGSSGPDILKELKIGGTVGTLSVKEYYTNGWPLYLVNIIASTTLEENTFYLQLRVNDNEKPLLAGYAAMLPQAVAPLPDQGIKFINETVLIVGSSPEFTQSVQVTVPNKLISGIGERIATIVRLDYIKQIRPNDGTDIFPQNTGLDHLFGPITTDIPWDSADGTQWISSHHYKYYDGLSQGYAIGTREVVIDSINPALRTITINSLIQEQVNEKIQIKNTTITTNVGEYTILNIETLTSTTILTVDENIPGTLQTGDLLKFETEIFVYIDKVNSRLIARNQDLTTNLAYQAGSKIKLYGVYTDQTISRFGITSFSVVSGDSYLGFSSNDFNEVGFGAIMETGMVSESDLTSGGTGDKDNVILYSVPQHYFQSKGIQTTTFFNYRGGTTYSERFIDTIKKTAKNFDVVKTSLHPSVGTTLVIMSYNDSVKVKENIHFLGLKKSEFETLKTAASTQLSSYHLKMCKLILQGGRKRDADYEPYYEYNLVVTGLNNSGVYAETTDNVKVYSRDGLIFTSELFAQIDLVPDAKYDVLLDELLNINKKSIVKMENQFISEAHKKDPNTGKTIIKEVIDNKEQKQINEWKQGISNNGKLRELYLLDGSTGSEPNIILNGPINTLPIDLRNELNALAITNPAHTIVDIEAIIKQKASDLFTLAKQRIQQAVPVPNKDGLLYITRLVMRMVIRNHPVILKSGKPFKEYEKILEFHSRGFEGLSKVDFSSYDPSFKRILITGFDPFDTGDPNASDPKFKFTGGLDSAGHLTNASGNIALALDGVILGSGTNKAIIRSAIFPTRWSDFDDEWVENFIKPFFLLPFGDVNRPDMIITFSYGIHYGTFSTQTLNYDDHDHNWHLDRFAANYRSGGPDNLFSQSQSPHGEGPIHKLKLSDINITYIESKLPYEKLKAGTIEKVKLTNNKIVINHGPLCESGIKDLVKDMKGTAGMLSFKIFGKSNATNTLSDLTHLFDLSHLTAHSHFHLLQNIKTIAYKNRIYSKIIYDPNILTVPNFSKPILLKQLTRRVEIDITDNIIGLYASDYRINLILDDNQLKFRTIGDTEFVPLPIWVNYKDADLEGSGITDLSAYHDIYIQAISGSGGNYMSNEIHYRVSYQREILSSPIPNGHVHVGFHETDPGGGTPAVRIGMIEDAKEMIKKFNDIL